ncbi:TPR domain protein [Beauveria bassiana ARSEF 2860]|uniref:TPR domain protein n=1 Tax=Beauveria bassiana (strain ARSEF 2860) TaxID=655819 RepID=J5JZD8_BEAB2|nr:TPR domain protein [Beauveria bassiana ARSEF 2860]EJP67491.1 TPR domain protein [Beauveria bassiana ARSEF 2860]
MYEMTQLRNGQLVHDHSSSDSIVASFSAMRASLSEPHATQRTLVSTSLMPLPYPPSDRFIDELRPIYIKQMRLEEHHRGFKVIVRVLTPPIRWNNIILVVAEDVKGTAVTLRLYHDPSVDTISPEGVIKVESVFLIKEPFFRCAPDNFYSLRVDHISDIVWLESFGSHVPHVWRTAVPDMSSETVRMQGNEAVRKGFWAEALRLYTDAGRYAVTPEEAQLAFVNRSLVNLKLNRPEQALLDATKMNAQISPTEKAVFREIKALYKLGYFERCLERLKYFTEKYPTNTDAQLEMNRVNARLREKINGAFPFASMYKQASQGSPLIDCATFSEPVEVRESPGRGRGLFIVNAVKAGQLLLCEKAFVYKQLDLISASRSILKAPSDEKCPFPGGQVGIVAQLKQGLYHNPEHSLPFLQLHRGDYKAVNRQRADGNPVVDSFLVSKIASLNCFTPPRTSLGAMSKAWKNKESAHDEKDDADFIGIWIKASYVNHSCFGNCHRSFIGDMLILRAAADMEPGTELMFDYRQPEHKVSYRPPQPKELETYDDVQQSLKDWGFTCECVLCRARHATPAAQLNRRKLLLKRLRDILPMQGVMPLAEGEKLLKEIEDTYTASYSAGVPRPELLSLCVSMASKYCQQGDLRKSVSLLLQGLSAFGYDIKAVLPTIDSAGSVSPTAQFEIKRWGMADGKVVEALVYLSMAATAIAPSLSRRILWYAQTAYSMVVGEMETFRQSFPRA